MRIDTGMIGPLATVLVVLTAQPHPAHGWNPFLKENGKVKKGNKLVEKGKPEEAAKKYDAALAELSDNASVHYNKGVAMLQAAEKNEASRDSNIQAAAQSFMSAIDLAGEEETGLKADAFYNLGNTYFEGERWQEAAEAYRQSLKLRPGNPDAAHNLSLSLKKIEEEKRKKEEEEKKKKEEEEKKQEEEQKQQEQQEQNQQEDQQEEQKEEQEKKDDQQCDQGKDGQKQQEQQEKQGDKQSQEQKEQEKEQEKGQEKQQQEQQQKKEGQQQQQQEKGKGEEKQQEAQPVPVTQQQAEAILDALQRGEKNFQLENLKQMKSGKARVLKDW
jgi:Ca-activated chloride channel family protein